MAQTLHRILVHVVFSTKDRGPLLKEPVRPQLFAYLGRIVRSLGGGQCFPTPLRGFKTNDAPSPARGIA